MGLALLGFGGAVDLANAEVDRQLRFDSKPPGADVHLLQGNRSSPLGKTPLMVDAEFHSEMSILRYAIEMPGYEREVVEVDPSMPGVSVRLSAVALLANSEDIGDAQLRALQVRLAPELEPVLHAAIDGAAGVAPEGRARVAELDGETRFVLPLHQTAAAAGRSSSDGDLHASVRGLWNELDPIVRPLVEVLHGQPMPIGLVVEVRSPGGRPRFEVDAQVRTTLEMECVPGTVMKRQWNPCLRRKIETYLDGGTVRQRDAGCAGGWTDAYVHDPCATRQPVTRTHTTLDPSVDPVTASPRVRFVVGPGLFGRILEGRDVFTDVHVLATDVDGRVRLRLGEGSAAPNLEAAEPR